MRLLIHLNNCSNPFERNKVVSIITEGGFARLEFEDNDLCEWYPLIQIARIEEIPSE